MVKLKEVPYTYMASVHKTLTYNVKLGGHMERLWAHATQIRHTEVYGYMLMTWHMPLTMRKHRAHPTQGHERALGTCYIMSNTTRATNMSTLHGTF